MAYKDRDELLDDLFDHVFADGDVTDEDHDWFDAKITSFFAKLEGERPPGRRRNRDQPAPPARRQSATPSKRREPKSGGYGLSLFYGDKEVN